MVQYRRAIRDARYKLVRSKNQGDSLFDLEADPFEREDLLAGEPSPQAREAYERLAAALGEFGPGR